MRPPSSSTLAPPVELATSSRPQPVSNSWWSRIRQHISSAEIQVGGAPIHHTHWIGCFGNAEHRIVFCERCGGTTSGAYSPLLAHACRRQLSDTLGRHVRRMILHLIWPTQAMGRRRGRATCLPTIRFQPTRSPLSFVIVGSGSGGYHCEAASSTLVSPELSTRSTGPNLGTSSETLGPHPWTDRA